MFVKLRRYFLSGLVAFLPISITIYFFVLSINFADGLFGKFIEPYFYNNFGFYFRGLSIIIGVYFIIVLGFLVTNFFGRKIYSFFESLVLRLPFFRQVYPAIKEIALFLFSRDRMKFKQVVLVEYPRKGVYSFGFLTNEENVRISDIVKREVCNVFIPSAPGPFTGFVIMVPRKEIISTEVSVEAAIKFNVSGGVLNPTRF